MIVADHYVFSANGSDGNPDPPTFDLIFKARPTGRYHLWLTNDVAPAVKRIKAKKPKGATLHIRKPANRLVSGSASRSPGRTVEALRARLAKFARIKSFAAR